MTEIERGHVLVTGGAGYVGSALVPQLLQAGYRVTVLDLYLFGADIFQDIRNNPDLIEIQGDIRDPDTVKRALDGVDTVIHLACISNDPSFELDPALGKSINYDAFLLLVRASKDAGVTRFIYASSSSVYGVKSENDVTEALSLEPLTDYSKFKAMCEEVLEKEREPGFAGLTIRPATVCGYAPRQRLDVIVNILTNHAVNNGRIRVFGGSQLRPNIHIQDMVRCYLHCLELPVTAIDGGVYNAGYENHSLLDLADIVREVVGPVEIVVEPTDDLRSYRVSSEKIRRELNFEPTQTIGDAVSDLVDAFKAGKLPNSLEDPRYYNIKTMQKVELH